MAIIWHVKNFLHHSFMNVSVLVTLGVISVCAPLLLLSHIQFISITLKDFPYMFIHCVFCCLYFLCYQILFSLSSVILFPIDFFSSLVRPLCVYYSPSFPQSPCLFPFSDAANYLISSPESIHHSILRAYTALWFHYSTLAPSVTNPVFFSAVSHSVSYCFTKDM